MATMDIRLKKADTVICFELSRLVCLLSYFKRVITNLNRVRPDMPEGCNEKFDYEFMKYIWEFSKKSVTWPIVYGFLFYVIY